MQGRGDGLDLLHVTHPAVDLLARPVETNHSMNATARAGSEVKGDLPERLDPVAGRDHDPFVPDRAEVDVSFLRGDFEVLHRDRATGNNGRRVQANCVDDGVARLGLRVVGFELVQEI